VSFLLIFFSKTVLLFNLYGYETWSLVLKQENSLNVLKRKSLKVKSCEVSHEEGKMSHCDQTDIFRCPQNRISNEDGSWRILPRVKEEKNIVQTIKRRKANRIGHILRRNRFPKHVTEWKIKWREDEEEDISIGWMTLKGMKSYWKLKEEALDRTLWRTGFGRGCGAVARQTAGWWWCDNWGWNNMGW
jgi:hypothetical protein